MSRRRSAPLLLACAALLLGSSPCAVPETGVGTPSFHFEAPLYRQLSLPGPRDLTLQMPASAVPGSLEVRLDGVPVDTSSLVSGGGGAVSTSMGAVEEGEHVLEAEVLSSFLGFLTIRRRAMTAFEVVDLEDPDACEVLNGAECLLPYPSSRFLVPDASLPNGTRLEIPQVGLPVLVGDPLDPAPFSVLDGFSPTVQLIMHFPGGVDLEQPFVSRLLAPVPPAVPPPYVGIRTYDDTSLQPESRTVLIRADTGERIVHFVELDARAATDDRRALILRPGRSLEPGGRYIVAVRGLVHPDESPIEPEPAFAVLRDGRPTDIAAIESRRAHFEANVFPALAAAGVERDDLILAWDFTVQSQDVTTGQVLSMRDQVYAWLDEQIAQDQQTFAITEVEANDCSVEGETTWKILHGTFQTPLFLTADPEAQNLAVAFLSVDASGAPVPNGITNPVFSLAIPCSALDAEGPTNHPLLLGHGLFGTGRGMVEAFAEGFGGDFVTAATDWRGLSQRDLLWVGSRVIGSPALGGHRLNNFPALPDRLKQGQINTLLLARMLERGVFDVDPEVQVDGEGVLDPGAEVFYYGISLGGIMGTWFASLTEDVERFNLDVPAINFSFLLQRSTQFGSCGGPVPCFEDLLAAVGLTDPMQTLLGLQLQHELWVRGEPAGYVQFLRDAIASGEKKVLMQVAWLDKQVSNQAQEVMARSLGLPSLVGSLLQGLVEIPDVAGPLESALVIYDTGAFDIFDPAQNDPSLDPPLIPPLANVVPSGRCDPHAARLLIPASLDQQLEFLRPNGTIQNFCDGICDGAVPSEWPGGTPPCDPLP